MADPLAPAKTSMMKNVSISFGKNSHLKVRSSLPTSSPLSLSFSLVGTASPGWNASLSDHVLKNLRTGDVNVTEKDLQENLSMLEKKLRCVASRMISSMTSVAFLAKAKFFSNRKRKMTTCPFRTKFVNCNSENFSHFRIKKNHFSLERHWLSTVYHRMRNDKTIASDVSL